MKRLLPALALMLIACTDPVDRAAKKRIFSPEDPPKAVASASEPLDASRAASDRHVAHRVLQMTAAEATERLGPHHLDATLTTKWETPNVTPVELTETRSFDAGPGGVAGDFHALTSNSRDQGLEVVRAAGVVYARDRYGLFRIRRRDRGMAEREREEVHGALPEVDRLFGRRLKLAEQGEFNYHGRSAYRYAVSLAAKAESREEADELPPKLEPKGGVDSTTQTRQAFVQRREPVSLQGDLWIDAKTAVVVSVKLHGRITVPPTEGHPQAWLNLDLDEAVSHIGEDPKIAAPKDALPDEDKPEGIADALDRFGIKHAADREQDQAPDSEPDSPDSP